MEVVSSCITLLERRQRSYSSLIRDLPFFCRKSGPSAGLWWDPTLQTRHWRHLEMAWVAGGNPRISVGILAIPNMVIGIRECGVVSKEIYILPVFV